MGQIYKYDVPFGTGEEASAFYSQSGFINGTGMTQGSGNGAILDKHKIWGQPFNGKQDVDGDLTITHGNLEMGCGDAHVGSVTDNEAAEGGNLTVDKHTKTNTLEVTENASIGGNVNVEGTMYVVNNLTTDGHLLVDAGAEIYGETFTDIITSTNGVINEIKSTDITTDYLTVLKSATFFEVIIEKLKSIGGSIILSPADGFVVSDVETYTKNISGKEKQAGGIETYKTVSFLAKCYKLYWLAETSDAGGNTITLDNQWRVGDMMLCQSFNIKQGTTQNAATKYYWCVVTATGTVAGTDTTPRKNWIEIVDNDTYYYPEDASAEDRGLPEGTPTIARLIPNCKFKDEGCIVNPAVGDNIAHLGNVYCQIDETNRGNAIYTSCVASKDYDLTPPFIATYKDIDSYNLSAHRHSQISPHGNFLRGTFYAGTSDKSIDEVMNELNGQLGTLENTVNDQSSSISSLEVAFNGIKTRVETVEGNYSSLEQSVNSFKTTVNNTLSNHSTQISQNADDISFYADEIEKLKITKDKIILNGDTIVNGQVNINKDGTGFLLSGSNGRNFTIGSNDIGSYDSFSSLTANSWTVYMERRNYVIGTGVRSVNYQEKESLGVFKRGQQIQVKNIIAYILDVFTGSFNIIVDIRNSSDTSVYNVEITNSATSGYEYDSSNNHWGGSKSPILSYNITNDGEYFLCIRGTLTRAENDNASSVIDIDLEFITYVSSSVNSFGKLTYNGFGFNFGGNNLMFVGDDRTVIKYSSNGGVMFDSAFGMRRLVPSQFYVNHNGLTPATDNSAIKIAIPKNGGQWIGINDYVVRVVTPEYDGSRTGYVDVATVLDEMMIIELPSNGKHVIIKLPAPSDAVGKSFIIKQKFGGNSNCWVSGNGAVLATSSGSGKIIKWNDSSVYDSYVDCMTQFDSTSKRYYGLCKIERHSYKFVSDGTNWISMLLSA